MQVNANQLTLIGDNHKVFLFEQNVNLVLSTKNSVGKTTLLRLLMYALGYPIPSTRGIRFSEYETVLTVVGANNEIFVLTRNRDYIEVLHNKVDKGYSLPVEQNELHSLIYGITNLEVVDNLLGAFFLDQEKGWTLLNRGKVIGNIRFSIESLLRGLSNRTNDELAQRHAVVKREIQKYKHMLDIAAYKAEINRLGETSFIDSPADDIENALEVLYCERKPLEKELSRIKSVIRKNTNFEKFITSFGLRVKAPNGDEVPVNKDTLIGFGDTADLLVARQKINYEQLAAIDRKIALLKAQQDDEAMLVDVKTGLQQFDSEIAKINVDALATQKIIAKLEQERKLLEQRVINSVKHDNPLISELHQLISSYAARLGLDERYISAKNDYIFTNDLKSLSGAIYHKVVFAFKISYVKLIQQHTGLYLPLILDSPSGREVSVENINEMMTILAEDYADHQIIIASIYNSYAFPNKNTIVLQDRMLPF
ncbi:hypothetical protein [Paenibacillus stellifer]|uniref:hypothetical protein n=1 Tax=Paenibacillus stellifer TaxID=169760 RepID=UPI00146FF79A|nr:hypothetical protein [Paenibacillus stellifer]